MASESVQRHWKLIRSKKRKQCISLATQVPRCFIHHAYPPFPRCTRSFTVMQLINHAELSCDKVVIHIQKRKDDCGFYKHTA